MNSLYSKIYEISQDDIKRLPIRDFYGIFEKYTDLYAKGYGRSGQLIEVNKPGRLAYNISVYIDNTPVSNPYNKRFDFSNISLELVDRIKINDNYLASSSGLRIDIFTKNIVLNETVSKDDSTKTTINEPFSEVDYKDAFFNHRDLSISLAQNFTENSSFFLFGNILNYMDYRERGDIFNFPLEIQDYFAKINLPNFSDKFLSKNMMSSSYYKKEFVEKLDTLETTNEKYKFSLKSRVFSSEIEQDILFTDDAIFSLHRDKISGDRNYNEYYTREYDRYFFNNVLNFSFKGTDSFFSLENIMNNTSLNYIDYENDYKINETIYENNLSLDFNIFNHFLTNKLGYYYKYSDDLGNINSLSLNMIGDKFIGNTFIENNTTLFFSDKEKLESDTMKLGILENQFYFGKKFSNLFSDFIQEAVFSVGFNFINYFEAKQISPLSPYPAHLFPNYTLNEDDGQLHLLFNSDISFWDNKANLKASYKYRVDESYMIIYNPIHNIRTTVSFTDKYFKDDLTVNFRASHVYSDYFVNETNRQFKNNFSLNLSFRILDLEVYYGIDNIFKTQYLGYNVNPYYEYQTVDGYNMQPNDEIWGVRWVFYH